jgi:GNAT superfamily N-acetyltransferase
LKHQAADPILQALSASALVAAIEGNIVALCASLGAIDGATVEDGPELLRFTTGIASPMFNGVARTRLDQESVEGAIDSAIGHFRARDVPMFFWWVGPASTPPDLGARLLARGFRQTWHDSPGMALDLDALPADPPLPPDFAIERVGDAATLEEWGRTFNAVFGSPDWVGGTWVEASRGAGGHQGPRSCVRGRLGGEPVATALRMDGAGVAGLYILGTVAHARRRGIGAALTLAPLRDARALGYRAGILHASPQGYPLYHGLGFRRYCTLNRYLWIDPAARAIGPLGVYASTQEEG